MSIVLEFSPAVANAGDQVYRILLAQDIQSFIKSALFDVTVAGEISTRRVSCNKVLFREETLSSSVVAGRKMYLSKPECILVIFSQILVKVQPESEGTSYESKPTVCHQRRLPNHTGVYSGHPDANPARTSPL
jgi:hypothetical protein